MICQNRWATTSSSVVASADRDGGTTCLLSLTRHIEFLQLDVGVTAKVPSGVETRPQHACNTSVARLISVIQFTFDPRLSQPPDYPDSYAPSIKVSLLLRLRIVVRGHRMANITKWHSEKAPPRVTGTTRHDS
jgi:hypothetical protein